MDCSIPSFPILHYLLESAQTHVHWVCDAIQPSRPLSSPSPPAFNISQHQGLFKWVSSLHQVAKVLEFQLQHQSFQWIVRTDFLYDGLLGSPCSPRDWPSSKSLQKINSGEGVEKREHSCTVGEKVNWYSHYGKWYGNSLKPRNKTTIWPSNPTPRHIPWANQNWKRHMYCIIHWSTICNS